MRRRERRALTARIQEEGMQAYYAGTKRCHNPHKYMDEGHWFIGWDAAAQEDNGAKKAQLKREANDVALALAKAVTRQISDADYDSGGAIELAPAHRCPSDNGRRSRCVALSPYFDDCRGTQ